MPGDTEPHIDEKGGAPVSGDDLVALKELLRLQGQGINVENAPAEKIGELIKARKTMPPHVSTPGSRTKN